MVLLWEPDAEPLEPRPEPSRTSPVEPTNPLQLEYRVWGMPMLMNYPFNEDPAPTLHVTPAEFEEPSAEPAECEEPVEPSPVTPAVEASPELGSEISAEGSDSSCLIGSSPGAPKTPLPVPTPSPEPDERPEPSQPVESPEPSEVKVSEASKLGAKAKAKAKANCKRAATKPKAKGKAKSNAKPKEKAAPTKKKACRESGGEATAARKKPSADQAKNGQQQHLSRHPRKIWMKWKRSCIVFLGILQERLHSLSWHLFSSLCKERWLEWWCMQRSGCIGSQSVAR